MNQFQDVIRATKVITHRESDQQIGMYEYDRPCCVGALLAGYFGVHQGENWDYLLGAKAFAQALGGNTAQVSVMLTYAGAGDYPFQSGQWPSSPEEVWENLMQIEEFPPIARCNFPEYDLGGQEFRGLDMTDTQFKICQMKSVVFYKCYMKNTDFIDCDMHRSIFRECHLEDCNFSGSVLHSANFKKSTIKNCEFAMADVSDSYFDIDVIKDKSNNGLKGNRFALTPFRVRKDGK